MANSTGRYSSRGNFVLDPHGSTFCVCHSRTSAIDAAKIAELMNEECVIDDFRRASDTGYRDPFLPESVAASAGLTRLPHPASEA